MTKIGQKKQTRTSRIKALDKMFSQYIRWRAGHKCEYCGKSPQRLDCHHGVTHRRYLNTRFEHDNAICVCVGCHWFLHDFPRINMEFFTKRIGSDRIEQLEILARSGQKADLDVAEQDLKKKLEGINEC